MQKLTRINCTNDFNQVNETNLENTRCDIEKPRVLAPPNLNTFLMLTNKLYELLNSKILLELINFVSKLRCVFGLKIRYTTMLTIAELIALLLFLFFFVHTFPPALLRESEGFKLACRLQLVYWWAKNCPFTLVSIAPLPARPGDVPYTLARTFVSVRKRVGVKRDKEILRAPRRNTRLPLIRTAKGTYIIRPRSPIPLGQRFGRYSWIIETFLPHLYPSLFLFWRLVSTNASF